MTLYFVFILGAVCNSTRDFYQNEGSKPRILITCALTARLSETEVMGNWQYQQASNSHIGAISKVYEKLMQN